ncbi:MAG: hypothetical protein ACTFAK_05190 [Candidatus Electronema sp. VV]
MVECRQIAPRSLYCLCLPERKAQTAEWAIFQRENAGAAGALPASPRASEKTRARFDFFLLLGYIDFPFAVCMR